jgi:hypothetical protein
MDPAEALARAAGLWRRADATRRLAAQEQHPELRGQWLKLASQYEKLAWDYETFFS